MKQPKFWTEKSIVSLLLAPFSLVYRLVCWFKLMCVVGYAPPCPVICVGNVTVGGAGKTPTAIAIAKLFIDKGLKPVFLSRGYGGRLSGPICVDPAIHSACEVGDEPLLLARVAPVVVSRDRRYGAITACGMGADVIIMDDGLQNPSIYKNASVLVIDGCYGVGNGFVMPAGPLRESLATALKKVQMVVVIGKKKLELNTNLPVVDAEFKANCKGLSKRNKYLAFAGIGNPDKFFTTLTENGFDVVESIGFPDHHDYSDQDIENLKGLALSLDAKLITTEKDMVRLNGQQAEDIKVLPVSLVWEKEGRDVVLDVVLGV